MSKTSESNDSEEASRQYIRLAEDGYPESDDEKDRVKGLGDLTFNDMTTRTYLTYRVAPSPVQLAEDDSLDGQMSLNVRTEEVSDHENPLSLKYYSDLIKPKKRR